MTELSCGQPRMKAGSTPKREKAGGPRRIPPLGGSTVMLMAPTMRAEEWPSPVVCRDCGKLIADGDEYVEDLVGIEDGAPVVEILCTTCGAPEGV